MKKKIIYTVCGVLLFLNLAVLGVFWLSAGQSSPEKKEEDETGLDYEPVKFHDEVTVMGRVVSNDGSPLSPSLVFRIDPDDVKERQPHPYWSEKLYRERVEPDESGQFRMEEVPAGRWLFVARGPDENYTLELREEVFTGEVPEYSMDPIQLGEGQKVTGALETESGFPLEGVDIVTIPFKEYEGLVGLNQTVEGGTFEIVPVPDHPFELHFFPEARDTVVRTVRPGQKELNIEVVDREIQRAEVTYKDQEGFPEEFTLFLYKQHQSRQLMSLVRPQQVRTEDGTFDIHELGYGDYHVLAVARDSNVYGGSTSFRITASSPEEEEEETEGSREDGSRPEDESFPEEELPHSKEGPQLSTQIKKVATIEMEPFVEVQGQVLDDQSRPLGNADVVHEVYSEVLRTKTNPDGQFSLAIPADSSVLVKHDRYATAAVSPETFRKEEVPDIQMTEGGNLHLTLSPPDQNQQGFLVLAHEQWEALTFFKPVGQDRITFERLMPGPYKLLYVIDQSPRATTDLEILEGENTKLDLREED